MFSQCRVQIIRLPLLARNRPTRWGKKITFHSRKHTNPYSLRNQNQKDRHKLRSILALFQNMIISGRLNLPSRTMLSIKCIGPLLQLYSGMRSSVLWITVNEQRAEENIMYRLLTWSYIPSDVGAASCTVYLVEVCHYFHIGLSKFCSPSNDR